MAKTLIYRPLFERAQVIMWAESQPFRRLTGIVAYCSGTTGNSQVVSGTA
jgi:hypothetical protein